MEKELKKIKVTVEQEGEEAQVLEGHGMILFVLDEEKDIMHRVLMTITGADILGVAQDLREFAYEKICAVGKEGMN